MDIKKPETSLQAYARRMGQEAFDRRMERQKRHEAGKAWQGKGIFKYEHTVNFPAILSGIFKLLGLYQRGYRNYLDIQIVENTVLLKDLPGAFEGYRILQIADLHTDLDPALPDAVISKLHRLDFDICINTGDYRNRTLDSSCASMSATARIYEHINQPCYGILGNHDFLEKVSELEAMGINILINESTPLEKDGEVLWLSGVDDAHFYASCDITHAKAQLPREAYSIMLSHTPQTYREVAKAGYRFMLSGHTHGGQICLPGGHILSGHCDAPRAMWRGNWEFEALKGYTSPGTGSGAAPLRFNCPPELTIHILRCA